MIRHLVAILASLVFAGLAVAEQRYALLVGNEDYPPEVGKLTNPHEDVDRVARALRQAGFTEVEVLKDATQADMNAGVLRLTRKLREAGSDGVGFFYYSGHGGSTETVGVRRNYMLPAKSPITSAEELTILGVPVDNVIDTLVASDAKAVFVISDACRNTLPITSSKGGETDKSFVPTQTRSGLYVAYSTADGSTAKDDGLFSQALAAEITRPGQYVSRAFTLALREVAKKRPGNKLPFSVDGLTQDLCFISCPGESERRPGKSEDERDWERLSALDKEAGYRIYLELHPSGAYVTAANAALGRLASASSSTPSTIVTPSVGASGEADIDKVASSAKAAYDAADDAYFAENYSEAAKQYDIACKGGIADGCANLGYLYEQGWGVTANNSEALRNYKLGCDGGEAWACSNYGVMFENGKGVGKDLTRAVSLYERACDLSDYQCTYLAYMYHHGRGVTMDYAKAKDFYETSCAVQDARGCTYLGLLYENGKGTAVDLKKASDQYELGCDYKDKYCTYLGYMYEYGRGVTRDYAKSRDLYSRGCDASDARACARLGGYYEWGTGVAQDYDEARSLYDYACGLDGYYCTEIGLMYENGKGVPKDEATAAVFYEQACEASDVRCTYLGFMYRFSRGRAEDLTRAVDLFETSCAADDARGCSYLGRMYQNGEGVNSDKVRSRSYYVKACTLDDSYCNDIGYYFEEGIGGAQNYREAGKYYGLACDADEAIACINLGLLYENGNGYSLNLNTAVSYYRTGCDKDAYWCTYLGYMYNWGRGVNQDKREARRQFEKSCAEEDVRGCWYLGEMLYDGVAGSKDTTRGLRLVRNACNDGNQEACDWLSSKRL